MADDDVLRKQTKHLLDQLRLKQGALLRTVKPRSVSSNEEPLRISDLSTEVNRKTKAKEQLHSKVRERFEAHSHLNPKEFDVSKVPQGLLQGNSRNHAADAARGGTPAACLSLLNSTPKAQQEAHQSTTPASVRKRRDLIDRNIKVDSEIHCPNFSADYRTLEKCAPHEFSYGGTGLASDESGVRPDKRSRNGRYMYDDRDECFYAHLTDGGNNRHEANFIRDATIRPKSILNTPGPHGPNKRSGTNSKVSFRDTSSSGRTSPSFMEDKTSKQLLGYDWIAGLIDNDPTVINQSEAFFDELRDFRRVNREECENKSYMEGPLCVTRADEPSSVKQALETKVKPFTINDRLFTVPVNNDWMASYVGEQTEDTVENKEPSYDAPRFVRVSIPRSTLLSPHRYKPHRRRSFDPTDSMALGEHCLKGWESSRPAAMPTASNIALKDASSGIKSKIATTLEEAEKIAASFYWPNSCPTEGVYPNHRLAKDSLMQLRYNSLLNNSKAKGTNSAVAASNIPVVSLGTGDLSRDRTMDSREGSRFDKSSTDKLLNTTYSMMYEMQKLKEETDARLKLCNVNSGIPVL